MGTRVFDGKFPISETPGHKHWGSIADTIQGAPIAGYLLAAYGGEHDSLNSYHPAIYFAGSAALASCLLVGIVRLKSNRRVFSKI